MKTPIRLLTALLASALPGLAAAQVELTTSLFQPQTHAIVKGVTSWCNEVAQATARRVTCKMLPKHVSSPPATFDAVRDGQADLSVGIHGYTPGRFVLTQVAELPFLGDSAQTTSVAYQRVFERHLAAVNEHKGLKVLAVFTHGPGDIYLGKRAISAVEDLEGLKFRVGGGMVNEVAKAIGANAILKPVTESYELMSGGVVDGVFLPAESVVVHRLEPFVSHRTRVPGGLYNTSFAFVMNMDTWGRIAPADQQAIMKLSGEHAAALIGKEWDLSDQRGIDALTKKGVSSAASPHKLVDQIRTRVQPLEQKWVEAAKKQGLADPARALADLRSEITKLQQR